ncbi:hypothetical protein Sps_04885 [Shewanella psychrophila]|uniref:Uncharacterized protein n=1 Tax=Shewanella psychrophila TaxID=225848 RepID=A0A1S6HWL3_9GAMM|nr:hypothetical protein [Shewanella psychrophila]AQS39966.1 hypothetical protein Sps_04885 [Shewanella psychrophila]
MRSKINICSVILLSFYSGYGFTAPSDDLPFGQYELSMGARPSAPYENLINYNSDLTTQGRGPTYTVDVSRHHIIPYNRLRGFYNRVAEMNRLRNLKGFFNSYANNLHFFAGNGGVDCESLGNDLVEAGNLAMSQGYGTATPGGETYALGFDTFNQFYAWLPGNLFIGPNNREDDPNNAFESNVGVVVGTTNFQILSRLNRNMGLFIDNNDDSLLPSISADLSRIARRRTVYQLNPSDWERGNGSSYRLRTTQERRSVDSSLLIKSIPSEIITLYSDTCDSYTPTFSHILDSVLMIINED